jgi:hypothetical protein
MKQRDIIILVVCTVVIVGVLAVFLGHGSSGSKPLPPHVTPVTPTFDQTTISQIEQNFPVDLDLTGLGRPDPFAGS